MVFEWNSIFRSEDIHTDVGGGEEREEGQDSQIQDKGLSEDKVVSDVFQHIFILFH